MKYLLSLLALFGVMYTHAQDTTKQKKVVISAKSNKPVKSKFPQKLTKPELKVGQYDRSDLEGTFIVDTVWVLKDDQLEEVPCKVGQRDTVYLTQKNMITKGIEQAEFMVYDVESMNTEDYLYRALSIYSDDIPDNLPNQIVVHKSDYKHTYGFGLLADGRVVVPYAGRLIYLKRLN